MRQPGSGKRRVRIEPEELRARVLSWRESYFLSRAFAGEESIVDDEASIEVDALVEWISKRHQKHHGQHMCLSLLCSYRYTETKVAGSSYFGSVNFRGSQRSALVYLPRAPFWALPEMFGRGVDVVELTFEPLRQGYASLASIFFGRDEDLRRCDELLTARTT